MIITGIDPDLNGGIAIVRFPERYIVSLMHMPVRKTDKGNELDARTLWHRLSEEWSLHSMAHEKPRCILETAIVKQQAGGKMMGGVHKTHQTFGGIKALCSILWDDHLTLVTPSTWKKAMGLGSDKDKAREEAMKLYPTHRRIFSVKKNAGLAEAVLLCHYHWERTT